MRVAFSQLPTKYSFWDDGWLSCEAKVKSRARLVETKTRSLVVMANRPFDDNKRYQMVSTSLSLRDTVPRLFVAVRLWRYFWMASDLAADNLRRTHQISGKLWQLQNRRTRRLNENEEKSQISSKNYLLCSEGYTSIRTVFDSLAGNAVGVHQQFTFFLFLQLPQPQSATLSTSAPIVSDGDNYSGVHCSTDSAPSWSALC